MLHKEQEYDSRVIKTVRNLKEVHSSSKNVNSICDEQRKNNTLINSSKSKKIEITTQYKTQLKRISVDGSIEQNKMISSFNKSVPRSNSKKYLINGSPVNNYMTKEGFRKTKSKYVQSLMNEANVKKYKQMCIGLVKNDNELIKMYLECGYEKTNYSYESFVENNLFNDKVFLYKLEMLLINNEGNFIKKNYKESFFKNEMIKIFRNKMIDSKYQSSLHNLKSKFEEQFLFINGFDLIA